MGHLRRITRRWFHCSLPMMSPMWSQCQGKICRIMELNIVYQSYVYLIWFFLRIPKNVTYSNLPQLEMWKPYIKRRLKHYIGIVDHYTANIKNTALKFWKLTVFVPINIFHCISAFILVQYVAFNIHLFCPIFSLTFSVSLKKETAILRCDQFYILCCFLLALSWNCTP